MKESSSVGGILKLGLVLALFAATACVGLAFVYTGTEERIADNQTAKLDAALKDIFGDDAVFEEIAGFLPAGENAVSFGTAYRAKKGNVLAGIALNVSVTGFNDTLTALVGVGTDGNITGVRILKDTDTPGLGANAASPNYFVDKPENTKTFYGQFTGMALDGTIKVAKDGGRVQAVTAATVTSRAVALLVNTAGEAGKKWLAAEGGLK
ncbi:MAG: FMN-binding protein [Treponema sp.]|jgi:electron transport complex protein RnfG|nr:FMN-binding protein [Treponema sp.]